MLFKKSRVKNFVLALALVLVTALAGAAYADVMMNSDGIGFVGKGNVQLVYGWNNAALQSNAAAVDFRTVTVTEVSWTCHRFSGNPMDPIEIIQERSRTTTAQGLLDSIGRLKNQITGFNLLGFDGAPMTSTDGPTINTCANVNSGFTLLDPAGEPDVVSSILQVSINGGMDWFEVK
jgi:hypothetical protein